MGRATVRRLASLGYAVVVNYVHDQQAAESTVEAVLDARGDAVAIRADVADELDVERLFTQTVETFGPVDAVVHAVRHQANARGAFIVNRAAARDVRRGGAIVNVFSSTTTAAIDRLTRELALEVRDRDVTVGNAVSISVGKPCAPGSVAEAVTYLLSDAGHGITGHVIRV